MSMRRSFRDLVSIAQPRISTRLTHHLLESAGDEVRQNANTRDLIFDVPTIIETLAASMTLYPRDVIATGTPAGVGIGFSPPRYLHNGDVVAIEIDGLRRLENPVRSTVRSRVSPRPRLDDLPCDD